MIGTGILGQGVEFAEALPDLVGFEVEAIDFVVGAATLNGGPFDDTVGGGAEGVAHVSLLENLFVAGASAAIGEELVSRDPGAAGAVDGFDEAHSDRVGEGDAEVDVPGRFLIFDWGRGTRSRSRIRI